MNNQKKYSKARNWSAILYPDSAPENWKDLIIESGIRCAISPLHDSDVNEGTGEFKKPHYHVLFMYDGPCTYQQAFSFCEVLKMTIPQKVNSVIGLLRYFTHKDNPEKHQYSSSDIQTFNGFDLDSYLAPSASEVQAMMKEITKFIFDSNITEYADLMKLILASDNTEWFSVASSHTLYFKEVIKGNWRKEIAERGLR